MTDIKKIYTTILADQFPDSLTISFGSHTLVYRKRTWGIVGPDGSIEERGLRYGENPDQEAALYELTGGNLVLGECAYINPGNGLVSAVSVEDMLQVGKHPGKINLTDIDNGLNIIRYLMNQPAAVILKHNNPCGVATADSLAEAFARAHEADRIAAFGGAVVCNRACDRDTAELLAGNYLEVVCAPEFDADALEIIRQRKNLRVIRIGRIDQLAAYEKVRYLDFKSLMDGGLIVQQSAVNNIRTAADLLPAVATHKGREYRCFREPTAAETADMLFGWAVEHGVTSNSVIYVKDGCTVGIGTGEQDRVGVAEIAVHKAYIKYADRLAWRRFGIPYAELKKEVSDSTRPTGDLTEIDQQVREEKGGLIGATMISDAFFPFRDGADVGIREGVGAILQAGGSMRDYEVIEACNEAEPPVAMRFTGKRSFKH
ncbi:MAG: IMP cyclohydrolase [Desulfofustis sp. PB-SRB1]|jgi:phosphoribosylaminoimidazolecarboxamide formyltransferase/IMP cyclohydrolase|nr:IMP cyclohydrolase [Desulfofustis sp. PB-SRB1]MBM1000976.1 IMP cyclohydrolase [Desulfofustis sp. PB-SRB1]